MYSSSDNEREVLCEKIINDLHAVYEREAQLSSFEIIPTTINLQNKSPVVQVNQNIGLESWCVKHVYLHARNILLLRKYNRNFDILNGDCVCGDDRIGVDSGIGKNYNESNTLLKYLNVALLINPDVISFWHLRRQMVNKKQLNISEELKFTVLVLSKKPKSSETFAYRRWLLTAILQKNRTVIDWQLELNLCEYCADRCSNNYHVWSHRQWLLKIIKGDTQILDKEITLTEKFLLKHISDYSAYHYRQFLIIYASQKNYYNETSVDNDLLLDLQALLKHYMNQPDTTSYTRSHIIRLMLPNIDINETSLRQYLYSFLFCCNLAAHDIHLMAEQKRLYGERESFELHRCASLKFIAEKCQLLLEKHRNRHPKNYIPVSFITNTNTNSHQQQQHAFLSAIQRMESLLGQRHRKWCSLFLGSINDFKLIADVANEHKPLSQC